MKKDYLETMSDYSESEKKPVPHKKYEPPMIGDQDPDTHDSQGQNKPGLWENIRKKKEREGKNYKPAKPGDKDRPDPEAWKKAGSS